MDEADLRRVGRPRFDDVELICGYDAMAVLRRLRGPLLWVLAGEDREAPIAATRAALISLPADRPPLDLFVSPTTDHSMLEFVEAPDSTRTCGRITDGYIRLIGDWIKGTVAGRYGRAERLRQDIKKGARRTPDPC